MICLDNFFTSQKSNVAHLLDKPNFELDPARRDDPDLARGRRDLQPGLPRLARCTTSTTRSRRSRPR